MAEIATGKRVDAIDLEPRHLAMVNLVLARHVPFKLVWAYGSRVKWNASETSDLDLVVFGASEGALYATREAFTQSDIPFEVQLFRWEDLPEDFHQNILSAYYVLRTEEDWGEFTLCKVVDEFIDYRGKTPKKTGFGVPLVTAKIIKNGRVLEPNEFIAEEDYKAWMRRGYPKINDVVLTTEAPLGEVALLKNDNVALAQRIITMRGKKEELDNKFLKYYLQSDEGQYRLQSRASGTTVVGIKSSVLKQMPISAPQYIEQKAIAEVLSGLDDKIDLLHRQNQTLESLAETLFRQWFIIEASEDWEPYELGDVVNIRYGKNLPTSQLIESGYPVFGGNGQIGWHSKYLYEEPQVLVSCRGEASGKVNITYPYSFVTNNSLILEIPKDSCLTFEWLKYYAFSFNFRDYTSGSAQPQITIDGLRIANITIPDEDLIAAFTDKVRPIEEKLERNRLQIRTLETLRDTLLPKLMSGDVRVHYDLASGQEAA